MTTDKLDNIVANIYLESHFNPVPDFEACSWFICSHMIPVYTY